MFPEIDSIITTSASMKTICVWYMIQLIFNNIHQSPETETRADPYAPTPNHHNAFWYFTITHPFLA
jgi:hypothetical protein